MRTLLKYCTLEKFRAITGVSEAKVADNVVQDALKLASDAISQGTRQIYLPTRELAYSNGRGTSIITHPEKYKIIEVFSMSVDSSRNSLGNAIAESAGVIGLGSSEYLIQTNGFIISVLPRATSAQISLFPKGIKNVSIDGVFGWMDPIKSYETETLSEIEENTTEVELGDVTNVEPGDILVFGDIENSTSNYLAWAEVTEVDYDSDIITFEGLRSPVRATPIEVGSTVKCYGQVPEAIKIATATMAKNRIIPATAIEGGADLKKMRVGYYSWTKMTSEELGGAPTQTLTGSIYADGLLQQYVGPVNIAGGVAWLSRSLTNV